MFALTNIDCLPRIRLLQGFCLHQVVSIVVVVLASIHPDTLIITYQFSFRLLLSVRMNYLTVCLVVLEITQVVSFNVSGVN